MSMFSPAADQFDEKAKDKLRNIFKYAVAISASVNVAYMAAFSVGLGTHDMDMIKYAAIGVSESIIALAFHVYSFRKIMSLPKEPQSDETVLDFLTMKLAHTLVALLISIPICSLLGISFWGAIFYNTTGGYNVIQFAQEFGPNAWLKLPYLIQVFYFKQWHLIVSMCIFVILLALSLIFSLVVFGSLNGPGELAYKVDEASKRAWNRMKAKRESRKPPAPLFAVSSDFNPI
ncbi:hypothetical protein BDR26DRAFT_852660 [Obelidium mucronatum]|nr:hypothetical protein BDR26DRAFT_852660 [Obelidium mucronatum]